MAQSYDVRPNLEGYDALTVRGFVKFIAPVAALFGAEYLASQYGVTFWLHAAINLGKVGIALWVIWIGCKALVTGEVPPNANVGPRYAEPDAINFISPRMLALGEIFAGVLLIADAALRIFYFLPE